MRRKIAMGTLAFMVLVAVAMVSWAQDGPPEGAGPGQGQHQFGGGGQHEFGGPEEHMRGGMERGGGHEFGGAEHLLHMAENPRVRMFLGLTDEQVAHLHKIGVDDEKASVQIRADLELRHIELRELLRADNPDHDAIMQKLDEANALRGKMVKQQVETLLTARSVLTPDQLKKVKAFMEHRGEGGGFGREHGEHGMEHHEGMERSFGHGGPGGGPGMPAPKPQAPPAQ